MKLFLFCTLIAGLGVARGVDVKCTHRFENTSCEITDPVTLKTGEKVNIISEVNLNSIKKFVFGLWHDGRFHISTVPTEIFEQLPNLETFGIHATVEVLNEGDFEKAGNLKLLAIDNQLKTIPAGILTSAKNLEILYLSGNKIAEIEDNAFSGLNALLHIELANNNLTIIKQNTFNGLEKLELLYLQSNQIELIEENALNLPNLKELYVYDNKLAHLSDNLFSATPLLETLRASRNQINHIGKSLYGLKNLRVLYLNHNKPTDVDLLAFSQLPRLVTLSLDGIGLTSDKISKIEIKEESKSVLEYLSLDRNELTDKDDWKQFAIAFPRLETINVERNKYSKIDLGNKTLRQQFPKLETVYVSSSEWNCDWLKNFIESSNEDGLHVRTTSFSVTNDKNVNGIGCV